MKHYLIIVGFDNPYPIRRDYKEDAGNFHTAIARSLKKWKKEFARKRIKKIRIQAIQL